MRRSTGNQLNQALVVELAKSANDIEPQRLEVIQRFREKAVPEPRRFRKVVLAGGDEECLILLRGSNLAFEITRKLRLEHRMRQLLQQHRGQVQVAAQRNSIALQVAQHAQQWQVGFSRRLMQPLNA